jgi:hypothetical protein
LDPVTDFFNRGSFDQFMLWEEVGGFNCSSRLSSSMALQYMHAGATGIC